MRLDVPPAFHVKHVLRVTLLHVKRVTLLRMTNFRRPEGSEITSPLAEYLAALVASTRGHLVSMLNSRSDHDEHVRAFTRGLRDLERLNALIGPDLADSATFEDD